MRTLLGALSAVLLSASAEAAVIDFGTVGVNLGPGLSYEEDGFRLTVNQGQFLDITNLGSPDFYFAVGTGDFGGTGFPSVGDNFTIEQINGGAFTLDGFNALSFGLSTPDQVTFEGFFGGSIGSFIVQITPSTIEAPFTPGFTGPVTRLVGTVSTLGTSTLALDDFILTPVAVPLPAPLALLMSGLIGIYALGRRRPAQRLLSEICLGRSPLDVSISKRSPQSDRCDLGA
ncbi:MAG: hypothetical protein AAGH74_09740 [Pseudomonadota bacterium]